MEAAEFYETTMHGVKIQKNIIYVKKNYSQGRL